MNKKWLITISIWGVCCSIQASRADESPLSKDALFDIEPASKTDSSLPADKEDLFGLEPKGTESGSTTSDDLLPASKDALFAEAPALETKQDAPSSWRGFLQTELAYTHADPEHWSKVMGRLELSKTGSFSQGVRWKASGRLDYNLVYDLTDHYPKAVADDQRARFDLRETYIDFSAADLEWRLGRQQIVWGEMVGLFFADVVSAKDMREFVLPDFQTLRIPQWAARAEYFKDDFHAELIWIPFPSYDLIGKPGAEFYPTPPTPPGIPATFVAEAKPGSSLDNTNYGIRISHLANGWDLAGFYYRSTDSSATFYREVQAGPTFVYRPRHERIWQAGGTLAKDFGGFVLKAEAIYTDGRRYSVLDLADQDGVAVQNTFDWVVGLDFYPDSDTRINTQVFQRIYRDHNPNIIPERHEQGLSLLFNRKLGQQWEVEALLISSLNRNDWLFRPKAVWTFEQNWKLAVGLDLFHGPATGLFGQYDSRDRLYSELRYDF